MQYETLRIKGNPMSEQAKILAELQTIIMNILKNGAATPEESDKIDALEAALLEQKCYTEIEHDVHDYLGEEIAALLAENHIDEAITKMHTAEISVDDFFDFIAYHDEDEVYPAYFTPTFVAEVKKAYDAKN